MWTFVKDLLRDLFMGIIILVGFGLALALALALAVTCAGCASRPKVPGSMADMPPEQHGSWVLVDCQPGRGELLKRGADALCCYRDLETDSGLFMAHFDTNGAQGWFVLGYIDAMTAEMICGEAPQR